MYHVNSHASKSSHISAFGDDRVFPASGCFLSISICLYYFISSHFTPHHINLFNLRCADILSTNSSYSSIVDCDKGTSLSKLLGTYSPTHRGHEAPLLACNTQSKSRLNGNHRSVLVLALSRPSAAARAARVLRTFLPCEPSPKASSRYCSRRWSK